MQCVYSHPSELRLRAPSPRSLSRGQSSVEDTPLEFIAIYSTFTFPINLASIGNGFLEMSPSPEFMAEAVPTWVTCALNGSSGAGDMSIGVLGFFFNILTDPMVPQKSAIKKI